MTLCVSGIVRAVHQSSSKLGDTPLARLDLFESLPSRGFAVEPLQQTLQQNCALHRSTTQALRPAADVELYSSTALQSALQISTTLQRSTLYILYTLPQTESREQKKYRDSREKKERKKTDNPREGWEDGTPPPRRDFKERSVVLAVAHPWASASS